MLNFEAAIALAVSEKINISHLRNAQPTVGPIEPHFRGQGAQMSNSFKKRNKALE